MSVFDFKFAAANTIPVKRADPDVLRKQTFDILENPHFPLLPTLVIIIIYPPNFCAIQKQSYFNTIFLYYFSTDIQVSIGQRLRQNLPIQLTFPVRRYLSSRLLF